MRTARNHPSTPPCRPTFEVLEPRLLLDAFSGIDYFGDSDNYTPYNPTRWEVAQDAGDARYFLNTTDYPAQNGQRLGEYSLINERRYSDFEISLDARSIENLSSNANADYCLVFGFIDNENYHYMMMNAQTNPSMKYTELFEVVDGQRYDLGESDDVGIPDNNYHAVTLNRTGTTVTVTLDTTEILSVTDADLDTVGWVGIGSFNDSVYFDNIDVTGTVVPFVSADAGADQIVVDTDGSGLATVTLDGSGSQSYPNAIASYVWKEGETPLATGVNPDVDLAPGVHTITLTVADTVGTEDTDTVTVTVVGSVDLDAAWAHVADRMANFISEYSPGHYPSHSKKDDTGNWNTTTSNNWVDGFETSVLWTLYEKTGDEIWRTWGETWNDEIESCKNWTSLGNFNMGFIFMGTYGTAYELSDDPTEKAVLAEVMIEAAESVLDSWRPVMDAFESRNSGNINYYEVIIDSIPPMELLFHASKLAAEIGTPEMDALSAELWDNVNTHCTTVMNTLVFDDDPQDPLYGSCYQDGHFYKTTGEFAYGLTQQGHTPSGWTRGNAWGLYGFTVAARETGRQDFLDTAEIIAHYFIDHLPADYVPYWDFFAPEGTWPDGRDSSAAALAASSLQELARLTPDTADKQKFLTGANNILGALSTTDYLSINTNWDGILMHGTYTYNSGSNDIPLSWGDHYFTEALLRSEQTAVIDRHVFYNHSAFDGNDAAANAADDAAIATDKNPLLPGGTATFANYTSYSRGINGVMVDIANLADAGSLSASDFEFKVGNDDTPSGWSAAATPAAVTVREGEGLGGSDRVTITWPDNEIEKQWLEVTVLANVNTGLTETDVFYFGNAVGESGDSATNAIVNAADEIGTRNNPAFLPPADITNPFDFNRDKIVGAADQILARNHVTFLDALKLISAPGLSGSSVFIEEPVAESPSPEQMVVLKISKGVRSLPLGGTLTKEVVTSKTVREFDAMLNAGTTGGSPARSGVSREKVIEPMGPIESSTVSIDAAPTGAPADEAAESGGRVVGARTFSVLLAIPQDGLTDVLDFPVLYRVLGEL